MGCSFLDFMVEVAFKTNNELLKTNNIQLAPIDHSDQKLFVLSLP